MNKPLALLNFSARRRLPLLLQNEVAECGLACLAMVAGYHGHRTDLNTLRRRFPLTLKGATLKQLMAIADALQFTTRALRLELEHLSRLKTPAILHWDLNHFVVLKSVRGGKVIIHDPARGERSMALSEVSGHFTGIALELSPAPGFRAKREETPLRLADFLGGARGFKRILGHILLLSLGLQLFALLSPFFMQLVVDNVVVSQDGDLLTALALGFGLLALIQVGVSALRSVIVMMLGTQLSMHMGANLFRHLLQLPLAYFEKRHLGDVLSRFRSLDKVKDLLTAGVAESLVDGVMAVATLVMLLIYSPTLTLVVLGVVAVYGLVRLLSYRPLRELNEEALIAAAKEQSNFMETVRAMQGVKLFGRETDRQALWQNHYADTLNAGIRVNRLTISFTALNGLLFGLENVLVVYLAAKLVLANAFTVGMLYAFMSWKGQFTGKTVALIEKAIEFRMLRLHLSRLADIALSEPEADLGEAGLELPLTGRLELRDVGFRYSESEPWLFQNLNVSIEPGESVALIGPSGCGKTTLIKIMLGLLPPTTGEVLADGVEIRKRGLASYRTQVAAVMQDDHLLSGSMSDNIAFFDQVIDQERVEGCAALAALDPTIKAMPMGYNTLVGDMGTTLSGGQRQRLLLARALYREPKILFLDEATSHLDVQLEAAVNAAVKQLRVTRILIAHRPETIRSANRVLILTPSGLVEPQAVPRVAEPA